VGLPRWSLSYVCVLKCLSGINGHLEYRDVLQADIARAGENRVKMS